ncbi:hypothetical protein GALL_129070 [mine drainage metagenome]|uniref:Uncharacterized protein n=1 Tax=mine drainage metagenome TaxID=410659 RepID=A0A1J5SAW0_9ZZZZ
MKTIVSNLIMVALCSLYISCNEHPKHDKVISATDTLAVKHGKKPGSSFSDTLVIKNAAAVFYNPDSVQLEKIKKLNKPMEFSSLTHQNFYLMRNAKIVLSKYWPGLKIIEVNKIRYLLFVKKDQSKILIDLDTKDDIAGIILFNKIKDPQLIDMMNIDTELNFYFNH